MTGNTLYMLYTPYCIIKKRYHVIMIIVIFVDFIQIINMPLPCPIICPHRGQMAKSVTSPYDVIFLRMESWLQYFLRSDIMNEKVNWYGQIDKWRWKRPIAKIYILREYNQTILIGSTSANQNQRQTFIQSAIYHTYSIQFSKLTNVKQKCKLNNHTKV